MLGGVTPRSFVFVFLVVARAAAAQDTDPVAFGRRLSEAHAIVRPVRLESTLLVLETKDLEEAKLAAAQASPAGRVRAQFEILFHPQFGTLVDQRGVEGRPVGRTLDGWILADGHRYDIKPFARQARRSDVDGSIGQLYTIFPVAAAQKALDLLRTDPGAAALKSESDGLVLSFPTHHASFKFRPDDLSLVSYRMGDQSQHVESTVIEYAVHPAMAKARFPSKALLVGTTGKAPIYSLRTFRVLEGVAVSKEDFEWQSYASELEDRKSGQVLSRTGEVLRPIDEAPAKPAQPAQPKSMPMDLDSAERNRIDPERPILPQSKAINTPLFALGAAVLICAVGLLIRRRLG
jgi:ribosomal protein L12E/L44/L45/RPP1/RPP2